MAHSVDPLLEGDNVGMRHVKGVGEYVDHFAPGLSDGIFDVVDWIRSGFGDQKVNESRSDVVDRTPGEFLFG